MRKLMMMMTMAVTLTQVSCAMTLEEVPYDTKMWSATDPFGFLTLRWTTNELRRLDYEQRFRLDITNLVAGTGIEIQRPTERTVLINATGFKEADPVALPYAVNASNLAARAWNLALTNTPRAVASPDGSERYTFAGGIVTRNFRTTLWTLNITQPAYFEEYFNVPAGVYHFDTMPRTPAEGVTYWSRENPNIGLKLVAGGWLRVVSPIREEFSTQWNAAQTSYDIQDYGYGFSATLNWAGMDTSQNYPLLTQAQINGFATVGWVGDALARKMGKSGLQEVEADFRVSGKNLDIRAGGVIGGEVCVSWDNGFNLREATLMPRGLRVADMGDDPMQSRKAEFRAGGVWTFDPFGNDHGLLFPQRRGGTLATEEYVTDATGGFLKGIPDGSVTAAKLADNAVATAKIANGAVTGAKIANLTITAVNVADKTLSGRKLNDGTQNWTRSLALIIGKNVYKNMNGYEFTLTNNPQIDTQGAKFYNGTHAIEDSIIAQFSALANYQTIYYDTKPQVLKELNLVPLYFASEKRLVLIIRHYYWSNNEEDALGFAVIENWDGNTPPEIVTISFAPVAAGDWWTDWNGQYKQHPNSVPLPDGINAGTLTLTLAGKVGTLQ